MLKSFCKNLFLTFCKFACCGTKFQFFVNLRARSQYFAVFWRAKIFANFICFEAKILYNISMNNPQNRTAKNGKAKWTALYSPDDSAIMFLIALLLPSLFAVPFVISSSLMGSDIPSVLNYLIPQIAMLAGFFVLSAVRKVNFREANGIKFKLNIWIVLLVPVISLISLYGFSAFVALLDHVTESLGYVALESSNITFAGFGDFLLKCLYIAILPAICEELVFRGVIANGLKKYGVVVASLLSAFFFALIHQNLQQLVYQFVIGFVFAYIALKTGSIIYTMILHFLNNFFVLLSTYISQQSGVAETAIDYSNAWNVVWPILLAIASTLALLGILFLVKYITKRAEQKSQDQQSAQKPEQKVDRSTQNLKQSNQTNVYVAEKSVDRFYKRPIVLISLVAGTIIWIVEILQRFQK